jgi:hypothetical protein
MYKGDPGVTHETYSAVDERAQMVIVWLKARGVRNDSHPQRLGVTRVRSLLRTSLQGMPETPWAQRGPPSDTRDLWQQR